MKKMRDLLRRWLHNPRVFMIVNTVFWLGLAPLLLTDPLRLAVGGSLFALIGGGYLLYAGFSPKITRGMEQPSLARWLAVTCGLVSTLFALVMLINVVTGGVPTRRQKLQQTAQERLAEAASRETAIYLNLSDLGLHEVPPEVGELEHLTTLDLSRNQLHSLPPEIGSLANLEELYLWDNHLESLPPEIGSLANLEKLYLRDNHLESLPPEIGALSHLEWLDLGSNRLETLPPELARLQQLTHLKLGYNRFTTFPNVILELPNLELLFLPGNRMGELPAALTQRAEPGALNLWYEPNASSFDWSSMVVIFFMFVLPVVLSWKVDRLWAAREHAQRQAARQEGAVFPIPPLLRGWTLFVLFGLLAMSLFILLAVLSGAQTGVTLGVGMGITLNFFPLIVGGVVFVLRHTGLVVLTAEGVSLRRPGQRRLLRYGDIIEIKSQVNPFSPALLIRGAEYTLRIPRMITDRPRLYELLLERVSPAVRDAALGKPVAAPAVSAVTSDGPAYAFAVSRRVWALYIAGTVLLVLFYLGIGLAGLWIGLEYGDVPPFTWRWLRDTALIFLLASTLFLPALFFVMRGFFTKYGPFEIEQPVAWELYRDKIRYRFPRGPWQERAARDLQRATLEPLPFTVRARAGGAIIKQKMMRYMLVLEFVGDKRLVIDQERAAQFGESPDRLYIIIKQLYEIGGNR